MVARLLWEQDAGCSSHLTPTKRKSPPPGRAFCVGKGAEPPRRSMRRGRKNRAGEEREGFFGDRKPGEQGKWAEKSTIVQG